MSRREPPGSVSFTYRVLPAATTVLMVLATLSGFVLFEWGGIAGLTNVELQCNRHANECTITPSLPLSGGTRTVPIGSIRGAELQGGGTGKGASYSVVLLTDSGPLPLSKLASGDRAKRAKADIDRFLADKKADTLEVDYDQPVLGAAGFMLFGLAWLYAAVMLARAARVEVNAARGTLTVVRLLGPLRRGVSRTFLLRDVLDATVVRSKSSKNTYGTALIVTGEELPVRLLASSSSDESWHTRAAEEIRALLVRSREAGTR